MRKLYLKYKYLTTTLLFFFLFSIQSIAQAQETVLKGNLKDELTGDTIVGAAVFIKGTKVGTQTDEAGNFELRTTQTPPFTLVISYIGFQQKEIEVYETEEPIEIKLRSEKSQNEVVVIGYGEQKRSDITGSVASVPTELKTQPVSSVDRLLQGSVAGVQVTQTTGQPGAGSSVQIRGSGTLTAGSQPLYVVDGFPIYNDQSVAPNQLNGGVVTGSNINLLSSINTSDIESIDVLKDASATAIYGSRGANGVVIINTKKGSHNKSSINYDGYYGVQDATHTISLGDNKDFLAQRHQAFKNAGTTDQILSNPSKYGIDTNTNTNWENAVIRKQAPIQNHNISILTGTEKTRVVFAGNYFSQDGILKNTGFTRYSGRVNLEHNYNKRFKIGASLLASNTNAKVAPAGVVQAALLMPPIVSIYNTDGSFTKQSVFEGTAYGNPVNTLLNQTNETKTNSFLGNISGEYEIINGLKAKVLMGTNITDNKQNRYLPSTTLEGNPSGYSQIGSYFTTNWLNENTLSYDKKIDRVHHVNAVIGFTQQTQTTKGTIAGSSNFPSDALTYNNLGTGTVSSINLSGVAVSPASSSLSWGLRSYLGRINYGFNDKYLVTFTARADGSSKFAEGHKWGFFPSAAVAWNASNEAFVKQIKSISALKFRFSVGRTGNQQIPPYQSLSPETYYRYNFNGTTVAGYAPGTIANPNLTWEKTTQYDFGVDLGLFKNRVTIVGDLYYKKTTDLLLLVTLPSTSGVLNFDPNVLQAQAYENAGSLENKGFELALNTQNVVGKKFTWNTSLVYSENRNKILTLNAGTPQYLPNSALPSVAAVGYSVGSFYVYQTDGLVAPGTPVNKALTINAPKDPSNPNNALAGQQQYKDVDGDGKITSNDRVIINNQPKFIAGLTNIFSYKTGFGTFDLTIFLQTVYGNKIFNQNGSQLGLGAGNQGLSQSASNFYTSSNTSTDVPAPYPNYASTLSTRFIEDGSYLRLKNASLGYSFPDEWMAKGKIKLRVYASVQNYLTWTKYTGFDPEVTSNDQSAITLGVDNGAYPNIKTALVGAQLSF